MSEIKSIRVSWIYDNGGYIYEAIPGSTAWNDEANTLRFNLREIDGEDSDFEVVILNDGDQYHFKTDYYDNPLEELLLKEFVSADETVLVHDGKYGTAYFHLAV